MKEIEYKYFRDEIESRSSRRTFAILALILICFFAIAFPVNIYFENNYQYITISGHSMQPTINPTPIRFVDSNGNNRYLQDGVYMRRNARVNYGDIVIINKNDEEEGKTIIKRLLGKGGDKITILKMKIDEEWQYRLLRIKSGTNEVEVVQENYLNGKCKTEASNAQEIVLGYSYWTEKVSSLNPVGNTNSYENIFYSHYLQNILSGNVITISSYVYDEVEYQNVLFYQLDEGKIFYMGDNRTNSKDARSEGPEDEDKILGKVVSITRNSTSPQNSVFYYFHRIWGYFDVLWQDFIKIFAKNS